MKIVHVTSEIAPIAKVGGLADMVYGLAKAQMKTHTVEVILPNYSFIQDPLLDIPLTRLGHYNQIYGEDEILCFARFCAQALDYLKNKKYDVLHLHDWPTALLAPLVHGPRKVLSIHNCHYQGKCRPEDLDALALPLGTLADPLQPHLVNILKGGILYSDAVVAVSPKYAQEMLTPEKGAGLEGVLRQKHPPLTGILNGIDTNYWNPATDPYLVYHYAANTAELGKQSNRKHLLDTLGLERSHLPLICAITRLVPQKGLELLKKTITYTLENGGTFILLGSSPCPDIQNDWKAFAHTHKSSSLHCHFTYDEKLAHRVYAASDAIVIPSLFEPCGLTQMIAMRYGTVPIVRATGGLADTVSDTCGFIFSDPTPAALESTLSQVFDTYANSPQVWSALREACFIKNFNWDLSAAHYENTYASI